MPGWQNSWSDPRPQVGLVVRSRRYKSSDPAEYKAQKKRVIYATDKEWDSIVEAASRTKYSTSEFIVRKVSGKKI